MTTEAFRRSSPLVASRPWLGAVSWTHRYAAAFVTLTVSYLILVHTRSWRPGFVDESDNFLGGTLIAQGARLYTDYFSHHMPLPYYLAAAASALGISTISGYRLFTSVVVLAFWSFFLLRFRQLLPSPVVHVTIISIALAHPIFWGHMLLAETFASYAVLLLVAYAYAYRNTSLSAGDQFVVALLLFIAVTSMLMIVYPIAMVAVWYAWSSMRNPDTTLRLWLFRHAYLIFALLLLFAGAAGYLVLAGQWHDFVDQAIVFNKEFYSRFVLDSNPIIILRRILGLYLRYARATLRPELLLGGEAVFLVANAAAALMVGRRQGIVCGVLYYATVVLSRLRGVAFHDQAYYLLSLFSVALIVAWALHTVRSVAITGRPLAGRPSRLARVVRVDRWSALSGIIAVAGLLLAGALYVRLAQNYPWTHSSAYRFQYADAVLAITAPDETFWVGPLDPQAYLATERMPASRYAFYLPWQGASPAINEQLLRDLETTRPPVIVFPMHAGLARREGFTQQVFIIKDYARALGAYLSANYAAVDETDPVWMSVFLRRERAEELRRRLIDAGLYAPRA